MGRKRSFKDKKYVLTTARNIVDDNKALFNLEDENVKVFYDKNDLNNGSMFMSFIDRFNFKLRVSKLESNYSDEAFKILLGHELTHGKFFKKQDTISYAKTLGEGAAMSLRLGRFLKKESIVKRIILELLCDINSIKIMKSSKEEVDIYCDSEKLYSDKVYLLSGYFPPKERKIMVEKYSMVDKIDSISFSNDFMKLYNKIMCDSKNENLKLDSIDVVLKVINDEYKDEFFNNDSRNDNLEEFKVYRF